MIFLSISLVMLTCYFYFCCNLCLILLHSYASLTNYLESVSSQSVHLLIVFFSSLVHIFLVLGILFWVSKSWNPLENDDFVCLFWWQLSWLGFKPQVCHTFCEQCFQDQFSFQTLLCCFGFFLIHTPSIYKHGALVGIYFIV